MQANTRPYETAPCCDPELAKAVLYRLLVANSHLMNFRYACFVSQDSHTTLHLLQADNITATQLQNGARILLPCRNPQGSALSINVSHSKTQFLQKTLHLDRYCHYSNPEHNFTPGRRIVLGWIAAPQSQLQTGFVAQTSLLTLPGLLQALAFKLAR